MKRTNNPKSPFFSAGSVDELMEIKEEITRSDSESSDESEDEEQLEMQIKHIENKIQQQIAQWREQFSPEQLTQLHTVTANKLEKREESEEVLSTPPPNLFR